MDIIYRFHSKSMPRLGDRVKDEKLKSIGEVVQVDSNTGNTLVRFKDLHPANEGMNESLPEDNPTGGPMSTQAPVEEQPIEPYGAQVLRRIHQDTAALLVDYEEMMGVLDNETVKGHMIEKMKLLTKEISTIEKLFKKTYKELNPLVEEEVEGGIEEIPSNPSMDGMGDVQNKDMYNPGQYEADSTPKEELTSDEVVAGMKCIDCGKPNCNCGKSLNPSFKFLGWKDISLGEVNLPNEKEYNKQEIGEELSEPAHLAKVSDDLEDHWALKPAEKEKVGEAVSFLKEIGDPLFELTEEKRMHSYHLHKSLEPIGSIGSKAMPHFQGGIRQDKQRQAVSDRVLQEQSHQNPTPNNKQETPTQPQNIPDTRDQDKGLHDMEADQDYMTKWVEGKKSITEASHFFKELAFEKAFGEPHRQRALQHCSLLEGLVNIGPHEENVDGLAPDANEMWDYAQFVEGKMMLGEKANRHYRATPEEGNPNRYYIEGETQYTPMELQVFSDLGVEPSTSSTGPLPQSRRVQGPKEALDEYTTNWTSSISEDTASAENLADKPSKGRGFDAGFPSKEKALNDLMRISQAQEMEIQKITKTLEKFSSVL